MVDSPLASAAFWTATGERAVSTFAQALLAAITVGDRVLGILDVNWPGALSIAGLAALYSVLKALAASRSGNPGPSFANERLAIPPQRGRHAKVDPEDLEAEQREQIEPDDLADRIAAHHRRPVDTEPPPEPPIRRRPVDDRRVRLRRDRPPPQWDPPQWEPRPDMPPDTPAGGATRAEP